MSRPDARQRLRSIADELADKGASRRTSVRNLLAWFGHRKRGDIISATVSEALREYGLRTNPDFSDVHQVDFDASVGFVLDPAAGVRTDPEWQDEDKTETLEVEGLDDGNNSWGKYPIDELLIRSETRTVYDVVRRIRRDRYIMNPDFQRDFIWKDDTQSRLIESVVMRIPLPVFYLAEDEEGRMIVVDGLQRLSTFERFLRDDLSLRLPDRDELHGKRFSDLGPKLQNRIEDCNLTCYIMDSRVPERARLDIFERVNSGVALSRQQMRNCLYMGPATRFLRDEVRTPLFLKATGKSLRTETMRDREFVNRFCAFQVLGVTRYRGDMDQFLADSLRVVNHMDDHGIDSLRQDFHRSLKNNLSIFGRHAFRKRRPGVKKRSVINASLWDVMATGLSRYEPHHVGDESAALKTEFLRLLEDEGFSNAITYATNDEKRVGIRFEMTQAMLKEVLGDHSA